MPLRDGFFSTATQTSCCNRIQRSNRVRLLVVSTHDFPDMCVFSSHPFWTSSSLDVPAGVTQEEGHTGGRSHRIFNPPSFCGACLDFCREKDSAIPFPRRP